MKLKQIFVLQLLLFFLFIVPSAKAVLTEENLPKTLSELKIELSRKVRKIQAREKSISITNLEQHNKMVDITQKCNELALILYSQNMDWTFDLTYAFRSVTKEYNDFNNTQLPFDQMVQRLELEIDRYARLAESLRRLPPYIIKIKGLPDSLAYHNDSLDAKRFNKFPQLRNIEFDSSFIGKIATPFVLNDTSKLDRDSCIFYAVTLLKNYSETKDNILKDKEFYEEAKLRLKESYDYAKQNYSYIQNSIFTQPRLNYYRQIVTIKNRISSIYDEILEKYSIGLENKFNNSQSNWRGSIILTYIFFLIAALLCCLAIGLFLTWFFVRTRLKNVIKRNVVYLGTSIGVFLFIIVNAIIPVFAAKEFVSLASQQISTYSWMVAAILFSILVQKWNSDPRPTFMFYLPLLVFSLIVFFFRIIFISNNLLDLLFTPIVAIIFFWQIFSFNKYKGQLNIIHIRLGWLTLIVLGISLVLSFIGYLFITLLLVIWWFLMFAFVLTLTIIKSLIDSHLGSKFKITDKSERGDNISHTWFYDFIDIAMIPSLYVLFFAQSIWEALSIFDMTDFFESIIYHPFINFSAEGIQKTEISFFMLIIALATYFLFKFLLYFVRAVYKQFKIENFKSKTGQTVVQVTDLNLALSNNLIAVLVWGIYVVIILILFKIPTDTVTMIITGLAAGIGMAMRDIMNNFFYAIQLMSGRLRKGDWIECDGIRGRVTSINYQCTQMETDEGAIISFLNADLLGKNFKNLTKNNNYEYLQLTVGIAYGSNIEEVRSILLEGLSILQTKDSYGQDIVDMSRGVKVFFNEFADSCVNVSVSQYVLVASRKTYKVQANEIIYNILNKHNIEIPFPQADVHIINS